MAAQMRGEREETLRRRRESAVHVSSDDVPVAEDSTGEASVPPQSPARDLATPTSDLQETSPGTSNYGMELRSKTSKLFPQSGERVVHVPTSDLQETSPDTSNYGMELRPKTSRFLPKSGERVVHVRLLYKNGRNSALHRQGQSSTQKISERSVRGTRYSARLGRAGVSGATPDIPNDGREADSRESAVLISDDDVSDAEASVGDLATPDLQKTTPDIPNYGMEPYSKTSSTLVPKNPQAFGRSDTILIMFYLEHLLPFLFPFYRPSILEGGRAWIFEMMISSPVVRQATLCQSSYFFSLVRGTADLGGARDELLAQITDAIAILRQALDFMKASGFRDHLHSAVRAMASIMQIQRFELAVLSFRNWQVHLSAAVAVFRKLLECVVESREPRSRFNAIMNSLGPPSSLSPPSSSLSSSSGPSQNDQIPSAEKAAFGFSSPLVILDDIIASIALQEQPQLYEYHDSLLGDTEGTGEPPINLEAVIGVKNWVILQIGEIAALEAWHQQCKRARNLDAMELVHRATLIKKSIVAPFKELEKELVVVQKERSLLDNFIPAPSQGSLVSLVWAHAALISLSVVQVGWQPTDSKVHYHVTQVINLLNRRRSRALLRTMVWPLCVAGCLAVPELEVHFRALVETLQPPSIFGTAHKALEIMENVWSNREADVVATRNLATCFRIQGDVVLLV